MLTGINVNLLGERKFENMSRKECEDQSIGVDKMIIEFLIKSVIEIDREVVQDSFPYALSLITPHSCYGYKKVFQTILNITNYDIDGIQKKTTKGKTTNLKLV